MDILPVELKIHIMYKLDYMDLVILSKVNHELRDLCRYENLWKHLYKTDFLIY